MKRFAPIAFLALLGCDQSPFADSVEETAVKACETALKPGLVSPASYRRLWFDYTPREPLTKEEMIEKFEADRLAAAQTGRTADALTAAYTLNCLRTKECKGSFEEALKQKTGFVLLEYESDNAFGSTLPEFFACRLRQNDIGQYNDNSAFTSGPVPRDVGEQTKREYQALKGESE